MTPASIKFWKYCRSSLTYPFGFLLLFPSFPHPFLPFSTTQGIPEDRKSVAEPGTGFQHQWIPRYSCSFICTLLNKRYFSYIMLHILPKILVLSSLNFRCQTFLEKILKMCFPVRIMGFLYSSLQSCFLSLYNRVVGDGGGVQLDLINK